MVFSQTAASLGADFQEVLGLSDGKKNATQDYFSSSQEVLQYHLEGLRGPRYSLAAPQYTLVASRSSSASSIT